MPTPSTIDIESLVQPIPGDDPAGGPLPSSAGEKIKSFREEFDPEDLDPSDPRRNDPSMQKKDPNWQGVIELGEETLKDVSKSLLVAVRMTEALTLKHGFAGARDGFRLLRRLSEDAWERMQPKIEEPDDLDTWAAMFDWLDDNKNGSLYPNKLKTMPVLANGTTRISVIDWKGIPNDKNNPPTVTADQVAAAARATDPAKCQTVLDDITETVEEVNRLGNVLGEKMGSLAPSFHKIRESLDECQTLAQGIVRENAGGGGGASADGQGEAAGVVGSGGSPGTGGGAVTREGAYKQLEAAADMLARVEPHSPVPYLVKRAVQLKNIKFPDLVEQLTKDANVLAFLKRDLEAPE